MNDKDLDSVLGAMDENGSIDTTEQPVEPKPVEETVESEVKVEETKTPENEENTEETDPNKSEEPNADSKDEPETDNSVIKTLRANIKQSKEEAQRIKTEAEAERKLLERLAAKQNITVEQLKEQLEQEDLAVEAKNQNMTPEALANYKKLETEVQALRQENQRRDFNTKVEAFKQSTKMSEDDVMTFLHSARDLGINLLNPNLKLENVYFALNKDKLEASIREEERQKVLKSIEDQKTKSPTGTKRSGTGDGAKKGIDELYKDLANLKEF